MPDEDSATVLAACTECERPGCSAFAGHGVGWINAGRIRWYCVQHFMESLAQLSESLGRHPGAT